MGNPLTIASVTLTPDEKNSIAFPATNLFASTTSCNGPSRAQRLKQRCFHPKIMAVFCVRCHYCSPDVLKKTLGNK